jgi:hypothetical protein
VRRRARGPLTRYQREALGFGSKTIWPVTEAFNRAHIAADYRSTATRRSRPGRRPTTASRRPRADADAAAKRFWQRSSWYRRASIRSEPLAGQPLMDELSTQGAVATEEIVDAARPATDGRAPPRGRALRRFAEASIVFLDLPDAVFRGYETTSELLHAPRDDDRRRTSSSAARSPGSSRRSSTCPSASATTSTTSSAATSASGSSTRGGAG